MGPPGNGKSSPAEALAFELAGPQLVVRYETRIGSFLGETAMRLAQLFAQPLGLRKSNCNALGHEPVGAGCI